MKAPSMCTTRKYARLCLGVFTTCLLITGCGYRAPEGSLPPDGNLDRMVDRAEAAAGGGGIERLALAQLPPQRPATMPVSRGHESAAIWRIPEVVGRDQWGNPITTRDGYWIYTIAIPPRFTVIEQQQRAIDLTALSNMTIDGDGKGTVVADPAAMPMRHDSPSMRVPWTPGGEDQVSTKRTTVIIDDQTGRKTTMNGRPPIISPGGNVDQQRIREAQQRIKEAVRQVEQSR